MSAPITPARTAAVVELGPIDACGVAAGDRLVMERPGGGGWGAA
ncbi:MAG TPA: hypothetical protein VEX86_16490 [Longimicrobium sp.]|nr:hypothetical protein [Longimicrobium sp.]